MSRVNGKPAAGNSAPPASSSKRTLSLSKSPSDAPDHSHDETDIVHPIKPSWVFWFVNRAPGSKIQEYEKSLRKIGSFASVESFWTMYTHLERPSALPPVTDVLLFSSAVRLPVWEEVPRGAKFTLRLRKGLADRLWEDLVLAAVGDRFEEGEGVVGVVLSVRAQEDVLSVWTESTRGDGGASLRESVYRLLALPRNTSSDFKLNSDLIQTARPHSHSMRNGGHSHGSGSGAGIEGDGATDRRRELS